MTPIYFDEYALKNGRVFNVPKAFVTQEGRSYEIDSWLARGGNAVVYQCIDERNGDELAVKFLLNDGFKNKKRFLLEAKLLRELDDPHISTYKGQGRISASVPKGRDRVLPLLVMEKADCNLQELIWKDIDKKIDYETYIGQFRGLAKALMTLHKKAIHRDIKPENILVLGDRWLLSDYGLCSLVVEENAGDFTPEKGSVGPKFWLSPEAQNKRLGVENEIGKHSDVFQLAAIFWYVLNGTHPTGILTSDDWTGPENLKEVIMKALLHNRNSRHSDGEQFLNELEEAIRT